MKKINLLILVDKFDYHGSYINGPTRYFSWLVKEIDKEKFNVHLCALRGKGKSDNIFRGENIKVSYLNMGKYNPLTLFGVISFILREKIDVLHLTGYGATTFGRLAGGFCRKPTIIQEHWVDPNFGGIPGLIDQALSMFTTRAIAISDYAKEFLIEKKWVAREKVVVIRNGVPLDKFCNAKETDGQQRREELGIPKDVKVTGIVAMLHENKGHKYFIDAASLVIKENPDTRFLIIGDGDLREPLKQQVAQLGLENHVLFLGHQDDIPVILKMLDIFVLASFSETAPLSLLEAMAAKKAIVTTDCGGPSEIVENGKTGFIVPIKDAQAIAEKIKYLIQNPSEAEALAKNASLESEKYNIAFVAEQIQKVYEEAYFQKQTAAAPIASYSRFNRS